MLPYGGIPFEDLPAGLGHDLGHPKRSFARSSAMYGLTHSFYCGKEYPKETCLAPCFYCGRKGGHSFYFLEKMILS